MSQIRKDILNGWKEIANYVGRDIRTVERWEKQRGLPIRRVPGEGRATVYAVVSELDRWFANADTTEAMLVDAAPLPGIHANGSGLNNDVEAIFASGYAEGAVSTNISSGLEASGGLQPAEIGPEGAVTGGRYTWAWIAAAFVLAGGIGFGWFHHREAVRELVEPAHTAAPAAASGVRYSFDVTRRTPGVPYPSRIAGVDDVYLRGEYYSDQRTSESLARAIQCYQEAISRDADYAPAYAGLSITYNLQREYSVVPDEVAYPKAKAAAKRAVELDPRLPQAHATLGFIDYFWSGDAASAEREFHRAIDLDPSLVLAHHWYGSVLTHEGRYQEALEQLALAQQLDPTSAAVLSSRALVLGMSGHRGEAMDMLQELLNDVPGATSPHQMLAILSMVEPRDIPRWMDETRRMATMRNDKNSLDEINVAEPAYRKGGEAVMWAALLERERHLHPPPERPTCRMGVFEAAMGNNDAAYAILLPYAKAHDRNAITMNMNPLLAGFRKDPRYAQILSDLDIPGTIKTP